MSSRRGRWRSNRTTALLAAALASPLVARGQGPAVVKDWLGLSGTIRAAYFSRDESFVDRTGVGVGSLWLTAKPPEVAGVSGSLDARVQEQNFTRAGSFSGDVREAYAARSFGDFDARLGRQITVWGRADKINPTDSWSTRDYTLLTTDDDDQRLGVAAAQASWNRADYHAILLWQPEWRTPGLPLPPLPAGLSLTNVDPPHPAGQLGLKLDHSGEGLDWSVSWARVYDRTPDLSVEAPGEIHLVYPRADVLGADAAVPLGRYGLRGEIAYTRTPNANGGDPLAQRDSVFGVFGVERTFFGELNVNGEYLYKHVFDLSPVAEIPDPALRSLAAEERTISNQLAADMHGLAFRVNEKALNETLEVEVAAVVWFAKRDSFLQPKVSYAVTDRIKAIFGAHIWAGPVDGFFGQLRDVSAVFTEVRYGF